MIRFHKPSVEELAYRQSLLADEKTMAYNEKWGGTIDWPRCQWDAWAEKWLFAAENIRFYRYICAENGEFIGEAALRYEEAYGAHVVSLLVHHQHRGKGYGRQALAALLQEAKRLNIHQLYDDIAADNPSIELFRSVGFEELWRTDEVVMMRIEQ